MRRTGELLDGISLLSEPGEEAPERYDFQQRQTELWDKAVLAYIENRVRDEKFRKETQAILKRVPAKRGAKPRNDISPFAFYHLLLVEKASFNSKTILEAIEKHCQIRNLPPDSVDRLLTKFDEGRRRARKKRGNSD
jgi:hypothetical protein